MLDHGSRQRDPKRDWILILIMLALATGAFNLALHITGGLAAW